jgi:hypothetical protein
MGCHIDRSRQGQLTTAALKHLHATVQQKSNNSTAFEIQTRNEKGSAFKSKMQMTVKAVRV